MAGASLLTLLDDIASVLDDVALMSKMAARKTAGVLGDDLAVNAEQVAGVRAERELPVIWAVAKGSLRNKLILVPAALALSWLLPWLIKPLLMIGGLWLCFEGAEKVVHSLQRALSGARFTEQATEVVSPPPGMDMVQYEQEKIRGAIRTDFILSMEIIVIALGIVQGAAFLVQVVVVVLTALVITIGVYSVVAAIVKVDDLGLLLLERRRATVVSRVGAAVGALLLRVAPLLMKTLSVVGTAAMFLVGGGIIAHNLPLLHHLGQVVAIGEGGESALVAMLYNGTLGLLLGGVALLAYSLWQRFGSTYMKGLISKMKLP